MSDEEMPPANLILQALHAIRGELTAMRREQEKTNERLDQTNQRLDQTNERLDNLRVFTVQKLTDLNAKVDGLSDRVENVGTRLEKHLESWGYQLTQGMGAEVRDLRERVTKLESAVLESKG
jgi:archaellum component FlaC